MKLIHHGVTLELPDDDPRVRVIETLLYGRPLPEFLPPPVPAIPEAPAAAAAPSRPSVPAAWSTFWGRLTPAARRWLSRLGSGPVPAEQGGRLAGAPLLGLHRHVAVRARDAGLAMPIVARGRGRLRRYELIPEALAPLAALAAEQRQAK